MSARHIAALVALTLIMHCGHAQERASAPLGEWATQGYTARVHIAPCDNADMLCGDIAWLWDAMDASGKPLLDTNNPKADRRNRSLLGLPLLTHFRRDAAASVPRWIDGYIYDPESGRTYRATLTWPSNDVLEVEGCVLFVCRTQRWRRASSLCSP